MQHYVRKERKPLLTCDISEKEVTEKYKDDEDMVRYANMILNGEVPEFAKYDDVERAFIALAWLV